MSTFVWNPYTNSLDAVQSLLVLDKRYVQILGDTMTGALNMQSNIVMESTDYIEFENTETRLSGNTAALGAGFLLLDGASGSSARRGLIASGDLRLFAHSNSDGSGSFNPYIFLQNNGIQFNCAPTIGAVNNNVRALLIEATLTEASSGNHSLLAAVWIGNHDVVIGDATVTNTANVYIDGTLGATVSGAEYALWVNDENYYRPTDPLKDLIRQASKTDKDLDMNLCP